MIEGLNCGYWYCPAWGGIILGPNNPVGASGAPVMLGAPGGMYVGDLLKPSGGGGGILGKG